MNNAERALLAALEAGLKHLASELGQPQKERMLAAMAETAARFIEPAAEPAPPTVAPQVFAGASGALQQLDQFLERWRNDRGRPSYTDLMVVRGLLAGETDTEEEKAREGRSSAWLQVFHLLHALNGNKPFWKETNDSAADAALRTIREWHDQAQRGKAAELADELRRCALAGLMKPYATDKATHQVRSALVGIWERAEEFLTGKPAVLPKELEGDEAAKEGLFAGEDGRELRKKLIELGWTPPQASKPRTALTREQIAEAIGTKGYGPSDLAAFRAIERAHGILSDDIPAAQFKERMGALAEWSHAYPRMNIYAKPGDLVMFDGRGGYDSEQARAKRTLTMRGVYEVEGVHVGSSSSAVQLKGVPGLWNTVMFSEPPVADATIDQQFQVMGMLSWTDNNGAFHAMAVEAATKLLKELHDEWPGGLEEIEAALRARPKMPSNIDPLVAGAAARAAFDNTFHKVRAEVSADWWGRIWLEAIEWATNQAAPTEPDYAALEREHFGDPEKQTGIYAPRLAEEGGPPVTMEEPPSAAMSDVTLAPLPIPQGQAHMRVLGQDYSAEQMQAYAREAVLAERERCALLCEAQCAVYASKMEEAHRLGREERWDRFYNYADAVSNIAAAIRGRTTTGEKT